MKIHMVILAALVAHLSGAASGPEVPPNLVQALPPTVGSRNVISGILNTGDKMLHRGFYTKLAAANVHQTQDIKYTGVTATRITYISALAVGSTQSANARIIAGGVNTNNVTIRLTSSKGFGFDFWVEIWGR